MHYLDALSRCTVPSLLGISIHTYTYRVTSMKLTLRENSQAYVFALRGNFGKVYNFATVTTAQTPVDDHINICSNGLRRTIAKSHVDQITMLRISCRHDPTRRKHARPTVWNIDVIILRCGVVAPNPWRTDVRETLLAQIIYIDRQTIAKGFICRCDVCTRLIGIALGSRLCL